MSVFYLTPDLRADREELDLRMHQHPLSDQILMNSIPSKELGVGSDVAAVGPGVAPFLVSVENLPRKYVVGYNDKTKKVLFYRLYWTQTHFDFGKV